MIDEPARPAERPDAFARGERTMETYQNQLQSVMQQMTRWLQAGLRWAERQPLPLVALASAGVGVFLGIALANATRPKPPRERLAELPRRAREQARERLGEMTRQMRARGRRAAPEVNWLALLPVALRLLAHPEVRKLIRSRLMARR